MKNLTWQQVAVVGLLLAGVVLSHLVSDSATAAVSSAVAVILAWLTSSPMGPSAPSGQ